MKEPSLTIGVEEEYQIIDPETRELRSYITEILQEDSILLGEVKIHWPQERSLKVNAAPSTDAEGRRVARASAAPRPRRARRSSGCAASSWTSPPARDW